MPRYVEANERQRDIQKNTWDDVLGFVTKVLEHDGEETQIRNHEVNVQLRHGAEEFREVPVHTDHNGSIVVPQKNDLVQLSFLRSRTQRPVVTGIAYSDEQRAPLARAGHFRREFERNNRDNMYLEAERPDHDGGTPETLRMATKADGLSNPSMELAVDQRAPHDVIAMRKNGNPVANDRAELKAGIENTGTPTAYIRADPNDDGTDEAKIELKENGEIAVETKQDKEISVTHEGDSDITVEHTGNAGITVDNSGGGDITVTNNSGDVVLDATSNTGQLTADTAVKLGSGGTQIIKDVQVNTTTDGDGHVTSVSLDITRSNLVETE